MAFEYCRRKQFFSLGKKCAVLFLLVVAQNCYAIEDNLKSLIFLALDENIAWQQSKLSNEHSQSTLDLSYAQFYPKLSAKAAYLNQKDQVLNQSNHSNRFDIGPTLAWQLPLGTQIEGRISYVNQSHHNGNQNQQKQNYAIILKQPLYKGFGSVNTSSIESKKIERELMRLNVTQDAMMLVAKLCKQYYHVYLSSQNMHKAAKNLQIASELLENIDEKIASGRIPMMDKQLINANLKQKEATLLEAKEQWLASKMTLSYLIGGKDVEPYLLSFQENRPELFIEESKDSIVTSLSSMFLEDWNTYKVFEQKKLMNKIQKKQLEDRKKMDVNMVAGANFNRLQQGVLTTTHSNSFQNTYTIGLEVSKALTSSGDEKQSEKNYALAHERLILENKELTLKFEQEKKAFERKYKSLSNQLLLKKQAYELSALNLEATRLKAQAGRISLQELLQAQYHHDLLNDDMISVDLAFFELSLDVDIFTNQLLKKLGLNLDVQI